MRKRLFVFFTLIFALFLTAVPVSADSGPKPYVSVEFTGLKSKNCYVTLLSKEKSTGPYWAYDGSNEKLGLYDTAEWKAVWAKFNSYRDKDGFYFLQNFSKPDSDSTYRWTYFPPDRFKILLYFPDSDSFAVSDGIYDRYAFHSQFHADVSGLTQPVKNGSVFHAEKGYDYSTETVSFLARYAITIAVELLIALAFSFSAKKQILVIVITNLVTQGILNLLLNYFNYTGGSLSFVGNYVWMELVVFGVEAAIYSKMLPKRSKHPERPQSPVLYAFLANLASFLAGIIVASVVPGIF